ncbi:hypothetical protein LCGC14_2000360 [marine sediment metagenome]|uniref:Uncharacterized protein n=1 Tax=marine sediment metagenome TaxID=412755 RepID=A0A0F9F3A8_9ZZZZ
MGKFFNDFIKGMPNSAIRKLKGSTKVSENRIYGQTKGFLEEERKNFNKPPLYVSDKDKKKDG